MKRIFFLSFFSVVLSVCVTAQLPQYYNYNTNGTNNSFPFNQAAGKMVQYLYLPGEFTQPTPAPNGNIVKWWFRIGDTYPLNATYTNLYIRMGKAGITELPVGTFYTGPMDTVFFRASHTLTGAGGTWVSITLDAPFAYRNDSALVIEIGQCASTQGSGFSVCNTTPATSRRNWSVGGCPFVYTNRGLQIINSGVDIAIPPQPPNLLYYKFEDSPSPTAVWNCALNGVGSNPAPLGVGTPLTSGGQFDTCISGTGLATGGITPGWNWNTGTSSWTISLWMEIPTSTSGTAYYFFGDAGVTSFRCFHNGVAGSNNLLLRGPIPDLLVTGIGPSPTVVTFVYDSAASQVRAYKNGVFAAQVTATLNMTAGTGFKVGGYGTSPSFFGKIDEFRLYRRALDTAEISAVYNQNIGCAYPVGISGNSNEIPNSYNLGQNYPNPFNPTTLINYNLPVNGFVTLKVFDVLGREVAELVNAEQKAGRYEVQFDGTKLSSGVYFYTLRAGDFTDTKKMLLVK
jgi:hypothetical protein